VKSRFISVSILLLGVACGSPAERIPAGRESVPGDLALWADSVNATMERELRRIDAEAARIDSIFQPLPLLQPGQENTLRRFGNAQQLERAATLGVRRALPPEGLSELQTQGSLVLLEDTEHWVVRDLDHSQPLAVPSVRTLLTEIGRRFSARLAEIGAPAFRLEVTSALRTAADQAALRQLNPNAALGESTHEYGTTVDVLYSAFSAPVRPIVDLDAGEAGWLLPHLSRYAAVAAERVAARRALELKAILGEVLIELQNEGIVMVTMERLQPVYHITVSRDLQASPSTERQGG
jgi:hypothetical protein